MECVRTFVKSDQFSRNRILLVALAIRLTLVLYAHIHDYIFKVNFTDIDYKVFSDAATHVSNGGSPFDRLTYRYTPALAWILLPVVNFPDFGKVLFVIFDIVVALLYFWIMEKDLVGKTKEERIEIENKQTENVVIFWLANPLTAIISARGNAEAIVAAIVLLNLLLLQKGYYKSAALVHGALAIHFKIYPIIYLPSVFLSLSNLNNEKGLTNKIKCLFTNWKGLIYVAITILSFIATVVFFYQFYGQLFLDEYLIYHIKRTDIKHNFSIYFFILYITEQNEMLSKIIGLAAFIPQIVLIVYFAFKHFDQLPFCWFITTFGFVAFNKVCTSQYFVWYIVLLPLVAHKVQMTSCRAIVLISAWFIGQALWLLPAYLFEFRGWPTFEAMFIASCVFLVINSVILKEVIKHYKSDEKTKSE